MILHNGGKYSGDESSLPQREHAAGAVPFKEAGDMKGLSLICNIGCIALIIILAVPFILLAKKYITHNAIWMMLGGICACFAIFPHELLHAICFKKDVYFYTNFSNGLAFVVGTEDMSKSRFIFMSLCPNIVLGLVPYVIFLIFPNIVFCGLFGLICLGMGFGDYINVYNAATQMPRGAKTYLSGTHSYWYLEEG